MICMMLSLLGAAAPVLDPVEGTTIDAETRDLLPSGGYLANVADVWLLEVVDLHPGGGGALSRFDPVRLSSHGRSFTQLRFFVNDVDITDPAVPGRPLLELPHGSWQSLRYESLWSNAPGFRWRLELAPPELTAAARARGGEAVGGDTWVPAGLMDREPATRHGATPERRELDGAWSLSLDGSGAVGRLGAEYISEAHRYPTLVNGAGRDIADRAERGTVLAGARLTLGEQAIELFAAGQAESRSHAGAEMRFPEPLTLRSDAAALVAQAQSLLRPAGKLELELALGVGMRRDRARPRADAPVVSDLEGEWEWMERPRFGDDLERWRADATARARLGGLELDLEAFRAQLTSRPVIVGGRTATSFARASQPGDASVSLTEWMPAERAEEWLGGLRLGAEAPYDLGPLLLRGVLALDWSGVGATEGRDVGAVAPAAGLLATVAHGGAELFLLIRHEPERFTAEVAEFVDRARPSGRRYRWLDDGDGIPEAGESGSLLSRTGGAWHTVDPELARPASEQLALGVRTGRFGPFRAVLSGVARALRNRWTVRLEGPAADSYTRRVVSDPGGDGLGESAELHVWDRSGGTEGEEIYRLGNDSRPNWYVGAEVQLYTEATRWWFLSLGGAGYWNTGRAPFGVFADRNDPGIVDEIDADPNARVNGHGRIDADRAFALHLLAGLRPFPYFSAAMALRYRDGEPMTRFLIVEDAPQGPTAIMAVPRGDPVPRFTFHMTLDARLRLEMQSEGVRFAAVLDAINLLGSGTEMLEEMRTGEGYRRSLEMVPGRTLLFGIEASI